MAQELELQKTATVEFATDDFAALLQKEFKPNSDSKKARIEQAVQTLAQQALADAKIVGDDVFSTVDAIISALDRKLTEQVKTSTSPSLFKIVHAS